MDLPAIILAVASLVTALATFATAVRTHAAVKTTNGQTIGQITSAVGDVVVGDTAAAAAIGGRRAADKQEDPLA